MGMKMGGLVAGWKLNEGRDVGGQNQLREGE